MRDAMNSLQVLQGKQENIEKVTLLFSNSKEKGSLKKPIINGAIEQLVFRTILYWVTSTDTKLILEEIILFEYTILGIPATF